MGNGEKSARNPDTGKLFNIPANMRYLDFKKVFIDKEITFDEWKKGINNKSKKYYMLDSDIMYLYKVNNINILRSNVK